MNTILSQVTILFRNRRKSVLYVSLAVLTVAVEEIFEQIVFKCPCIDHMAYGMAFILAPTLLLFVLGIVLDKEALVILLPCTKSYNDANDETRMLPRTARIFESIFRTFEFAARACAAPMVWVVLSLLRKQYYVCAFFGPPVGTIAENPRFPLGHQGNTTDECGNTEPRERLLEQIAYQTYSQVLGCWLMAASIGVFLLLVVLRRFSGKRRQFHMFGNHIYQHIEAKAAILEFHKEAKQLAEENGKEMVYHWLRIQSSGNYINDIAKARIQIVGKYSQYTVVPDSPTTPVAPREDGSDGPEVCSQTDQENQEPQRSSQRGTSTPASPDRENMYIESRNLTRVIYLRETTT